jgi:hypothetical protein
MIELITQLHMQGIIYVQTIYILAVSLTSLFHSY